MPKAPGDSALWKLAGLGFQFAASSVIFALIGVYIDKRTGWSPWGVVSLVFLALIGNLYLLIKEGLKSDNPPGKKPDHGSHPPNGGSS
ncbi:MAG: AtpZ/AtpI family protein [Phycisphaerae bacterium]